MNIAELFFESAKKHPGRIAIIHRHEQITYAELQQQVQQSAAYFRSKGIAKGDRVLVFVPMSIDLYRIVLALFSMGAVAVFLDEWVSFKRLEACCKVAPCKGFIGIAKARVLSWFSGELRRIPVKLALKGRTVPGEPLTECEPADIALITFTTGSTGTPKAAKRTHGFLREQFEALIEKINPREGDVDMSLLPIVLLINLGSGVTSVIADFSAKKPQRFKPAHLVDQINTHGVNRLTGSPFFLKELSNHVRTNEILLQSVRQVFTGGAPVFTHEARLMQEAFPLAEVEIVYGSTEAEPISAVNARQLMQEQALGDGLLVGTPYRKSEVRIIPVSDAPVLVAAGEGLAVCGPLQVGEITVAGPHVLTEYVNNDEALKRNKIFAGNKIYHRTGDSGFLDHEGRLFLTGRCATVFEHEGKTVYPFLYENYFQSLDGVCMGTVMQLKGQVVLALELSDPARRAAVELQLRQLPLEYERMEFLEIPRDPRHHSKIDYEKLRQLLTQA